MLSAARPSSIGAIPELAGLDWSFTETAKAHPVHGLHSYPAKFVPALPREVIARLSDEGDLILDPFCGSGTALAEALLLGRRAIGSDINPVALAAAQAKSTRLTAQQLMRLATLAAEIPQRVADEVAAGVELPSSWDPVAGKRFRGLRFWFDEVPALELAALRRIIDDEDDEAVRAVALMSFSSIVVAVSHQDSDTRYVRRDKRVKARDTANLFARRLSSAREALMAFAAETRASAEIYDCDARSLDYLAEASVRLVVTSPPYPNAWSYHLYHQNRILWLDADPWNFKEAEIGHHRAYSAKNGQDAQDFEDDMQKVFACVAPALTSDGHVVVVVGDSIVRGELVRNDETVAAAAERAGLSPVAVFNRVIDPRRKTFNPSIGKIRTEHVMVLRRA